MAEIEPSRVLEVPDIKENDNAQQYIEIGSNMFLGTKDGMKYTLIQMSDNKIRLVEAPKDLNMNILKGSVETSLKSEEQDASIESNSGWKGIKVLQVKAESSPCKGQGDEIGNTVLSPHTALTFNESDNTLVTVSIEETSPDVRNSGQLTYTTLLPRQEKVEPLSSFNYSTPKSSYYAYSSPLPLPVATRPTRHSRKPRMQFNLGNTSYSPIPRARGSTPRQRRPRHTSAYQYRPQILYSTPNIVSRGSFDSSESPITVTGSSSESQSSGSFNKSQLSVEYPRAPNNTPVSDKSNTSCEEMSTVSLEWLPSETNQIESYISLDPRETHNEKERKRRLRIKNACQSLRSLLPFLNEKTDNATVFEQAVHFIVFMRETLGSQHDMEFMEQTYVF